jgi:hypothetical protein
VKTPHDSADEWLKAHDPDYGGEETPAGQDLAAPSEWLGGDEEDRADAKALVLEGRETGFHTERRGIEKHRGRQRVTALATKVQRPGEPPRFLRICNDGEAIRAVLERDGDDLATFRAAVREGRPSPARRADRERLRLKVLELVKMGAYQFAIARELGCHRETVMILAGRQGLYPQRRPKAA